MKSGIYTSTKRVGLLACSQYIHQKLSSAIHPSQPTDLSSQLPTSTSTNHLLNLTYTNLLNTYLLPKITTTPASPFLLTYHILITILPVPYFFPTKEAFFHMPTYPFRLTYGYRKKSQRQVAPQLHRNNGVSLPSLVNLKKDDVSLPEAGSSVLFIWLWLTHFAWRVRQFQPDGIDLVLQVARLPRRIVWPGELFF